MVCQLLNGQRTWSATSDENGFLDYKITYRVHSDVWDGPTNVLFTPGLPLYGSWWIVDGDVNLWAWRRWDAEVKPLVSDEPNEDWDVTYTFSTKWPSPKEGDRPHANDPPGDPRLDPPKVSGSFVRYSQEATNDRFGNPIFNSAYELLRGNQVEFDRNRLQIRLEFNSSYLPLTYLMAMADTVNAYPLWGVPARCVKLSEPDFELSFFGQGTYYWKIKLVFDIDYGTWDRDLLDEGTKCLHGEFDVGPKGTGNWMLKAVGKDSLGNPIPPDPYNPQHYSRFKDRNGEPCRVVLNGHGLPAGVLTGGGSASGTVNVAYMWTSAFLSGQPAPVPPGSSWLPVTAPPSTKVSNYTPGARYYPGSMVNFGGMLSGQLTYLCTKPTANLPTDASSWIVVPPGSVPTNMGAYDKTKMYRTGDIITLSSSWAITFPVTNTGPPGNVHVEKYAESDFSLLGIPLTFPNIY
jgi:hypothetical protein